MEGKPAMKMSTLACMRVAGFAAGLIAGAVLSQLRWSAGAAPSRESAAPHRTVEKGTLPREPDQRTEADRQEAPQPPVKASGKRQQQQRGVQGLTKQQLYHEAKKRNIRGRSTMTKAEL